MKFCIIIAVALLNGLAILSGSAAMGAVLAYEGFGYAAPGNLAGKGSAADPGWAGAWLGWSGTGTVSAGTLEYDDLQVSGNQAAMGAGIGSRTMRALDTSAGGPFDLAGLVEGGRIGADGTTLYWSFLQQTSIVPGSSPNDVRYYTVEVASETGSNEDRVLLIGHDDLAPSPYYVARTASNESSSVISEPLGIEDTAVNLYVVKFTFGAGNDDRVDIYRNPSLLEEPATPTVTLSGTALDPYDFSFDRLSVTWFVGHDPVHLADEIRFGTTWASVLPVPEPSSCALLLMAAGLIAPGMRVRRRRKA